MSTFLDLMITGAFYSAVVFTGFLAVGAVVAVVGQKIRGRKGGAR